MNPEREKLLDRLFKTALGVAPARRAAYLEEACAGDEALREEVAARVAHHERIESELTVMPRPSGDATTAEMPEAEEEELAPGREFGTYMILGKLGEGGMGTVYLAKDVRLGRRVALKFLPARYASDENFVRRFVQEARAASQLNHPNILTVHEIGRHEGRHFIATEFIEGDTVRRLVARGALPVEMAVDVCAQVAAALTKAHQNGVIHRDIKPENVMVGEEGHVKVLDFGIAKQLHAGAVVDTEAPTTARFDTAPGVVLGTSAYMSPEQVRGVELDPRTDVWSLGCVLYEMLAGRPAFEAPTHGDLIVAVLGGEPPPLSRWRSDVPEELERVVSKALAKRREQRYQSARDIQTDLARVRGSLRAIPGTIVPAAARDTSASFGNFLRGAGQTQNLPPVAHTISTSSQRRQVTVLFADLAGLDALTEDLDAEEVGELMADLWPRVDAVLTEFGGVIDKHVGDTVVALWGAAGAAREDDPERAIRAALAVQETAAEFAAANLRDAARANEKSDADEKETMGPPLVRAGVSTGLVLVGQAGFEGGVTATGEAVSLANRLAQTAPVGAILVTHDTYRHVRGVFDVRAPVTFRLEGKTAPVEIYRVLRAKPRAFRQRTRGVEGVETKMIGRRAELKMLTDALQTVSEERELQVFTVVGDAGLGKSRLLYEFGNQVELLPEDWYIFNGRGSEATQGLPYGLLRDVFSFRFEIQDSDPPPLAREKLVRGLTEMAPGGGPEEATMRAHFVGQLIGLDFSDSRHLSGILDDARQIRDRAFLYAAQFFAEVARTGPIVLYFDDIHWADDGSLDFVSYLARDCAEVPMLVVCLARTSLLERRPAWGEGEESHTLVRLGPLSKKETRQLVEEILRHAESVPEPLRDLVVSGAEGNPFYVEELIKMLIEERVIVPGADEWSVDVNRLGEVKVPPTLTGVLQARLDNLTPREHAALQRASVVGRVFWDSAVEHLGADSAETRVGATPHTGISEGVSDVLESLRRKELIYRRESSSFAGTNEYLFKHTLLRDVTYESVLLRERRAYHRRVAEWLILKSGGRVAEHAAHVAEHYELARESQQAAHWYARAGQQARDTYAPEAAINYFRKALRFTPPAAASARAGEDTAAGARRTAAVELYEGLGEVLRVQARYAESIEAYGRMREEAASLGDRTAEARAWNETALVVASQGDNRATLDATRRAEQLAREAGDEDDKARVELARALSVQSQASTRLGDARAAMRLATQALTYATQLGEEGRRVAADSLKSLGMAHHILGNFERAEHYKAQALHTFRELGDRRGVGNLVNSLGETARLRGDYETAFRHYQEALSIAREIGNRNGEILYLSNLAAARTGRGDYAAAETDLLQTIELASAAGYFGLSENYRFLAEALLHQGKTSAARDAALKALELGREIENQEHIGQAWRVLGLIASHSSGRVAVGGDTFDADACFEESLGVFAAIKMESERARTLREWARHQLARGGDAPRGRDMLREARDIFTKLGMELEVARTSDQQPAERATEQ